MYKKELDGVDHINVYSKGKTELGRKLSNFAYTPFTHPKLGSFKCVEGFWYYLITGDERLRKTSGWESKYLGRTLKNLREHPNEEELLEAYKAKLKYNPDIKNLLNKNTLPFAHYHVYGDKIVEAKEWLWTALLWEKLKNE